MLAHNRASVCLYAQGRPTAAQKPPILLQPSDNYRPHAQSGSPRSSSINIEVELVDRTLSRVRSVSRQQDANITHLALRR